MVSPVCSPEGRLLAAHVVPRVPLEVGEDAVHDHEREEDVSVTRIGPRHVSLQETGQVMLLSKGKLRKAKEKRKPLRIREHFLERCSVWQPRCR